MLRRLIGIGLLLAAHGCAAPVRLSSDPSAAPPDFTVDVNVLHGAGDEPGERPWRERMVLLPDGGLHTGMDERRGVAGLPPWSRTLTRAELAAFWTLINELTLDEAATAVAPQPFADAGAPPGERIAIVSIRAFDDRDVYLEQAPLAAPPDSSLLLLVERMRGLAWTEPANESRRIVAPRRYDFGPDPYARYRRE